MSKNLQYENAAEFVRSFQEGKISHYSFLKRATTVFGSRALANVALAACVPTQPDGVSLSTVTNEESNSESKYIITAEDVEELRTRFQGNLILPDDSGYDEARVLWNARFDKRPSLIAQCESVEDVQTIVRFAHEKNIGAAVRSGLHDMSGRCLIDNELSIDMTKMKGIEVDAERGVVRVQAGAQWREVTPAVQEFGFLAGGPMDSNVTVSGYGLGGGLNLFMRAHGLGCDNILSIDMVTADGELITVNENSHADLFWGMRGAGANFGVVTSMEYRLYPIKTVLAGSITWALSKDDPHSSAREIMKFLRDYNRTVPDEVTTFAYLLSDPDVGPIISIWTAYAGDVAEGEEILAPLRAFGEPIADDVREVTYEEQQTRVDFVAPPNRHYYYRTQLLQELNDATLDALIDEYVENTVPEIFVILEHFGGAIARVSEDATAFAGRDADYCLLFGGGTDTAAEMEQDIGPVIRSLGESMTPFTTGHAYINYLDSDEVARVPSAYGVVRYTRLQGLKMQYDPTNVFRFSQSIRPSS